MIESINADFEAYVEAELGDIAVVSEGRYISPKIQNYFKVWNHQQTRITKLEAQLADAKQVANDCRIVADNAIAEAKKYQWIPVSERLPEHSTDVLTLVRLGIAARQTVAGFFPLTSEKVAPMGWLEFSEPDKELNVTHWMPLPKSPKDIV